MAYRQLTLQPGVNTTLTPTANATGWSASNLIRFFQGSVQRIGGWQRLFDERCAAFVRAMHPWTDLSLNKNLLLGTDGGAQLYSSGTLYDFTLVRKSVNVAPPFIQSTTGSNLLVINDTGHGATAGDLVRFAVQAGGAVAGYQSYSTGTAASFFGAAWNGSVFCIAGTSGEIRTSPTGTTWTAQTSGTTNQLLGAAWNGSVFCVVGASGTILTSPTGVVWTAQTSGVSDALNSVVWNGSVFCAVGENGRILTSPTGVTWTPRTSGTAQELRSVTWSGTIFCAVGFNGTIVTSPDGSTWTTQSSGTTAGLLGVAWGGSTFVVATAGGVLTAGAAASSWTFRSLPVTQFRFVASSGSELLIGGALDVTSAADLAAPLWRTSDGVNFIEEDSNAAFGVTNAVWGGSFFIVVGGSENILISADNAQGQQPLIAPTFYTVASVINANSYRIAIPSAAITGNASGGYAPFYVINFLRTSAPSRVRVYLQNHGLSVGSTHTLSLNTVLIGTGVTLSGSYTVTRVLNSYSFEFDCGQTPSTSATTRAFEGGSGVVLQYYLGTPAVPQNWFLDNLGEDGLICPANGAIYVYQPPVPADGLAFGQVVANSPQVNAGMFVAMPQAQIIAFGSEAVIGGGVQDPLLVRWSDTGSYTTWIATTTNQAGSKVLSRGSRIIGGLQGPLSTLLWTDIDCWAMSYVGGQLVYSFNTVANGYGLISPKARIAQGSTVYWISPKGFCSIGSGGFRLLECPIWDNFFMDLDPNQTNKVWAWSNSVYNEVWFFYPSLSGGTGEIDSYIKVDTTRGLWDFGRLCRTAGTDQSIFGTPLAADANYLVQQHEIGFDADGVAMEGAYLQSGYAMLEEGTYVMYVDRYKPDAKWLGAGGAMSVTLIGTGAPGETATQQGPYPFTSTAQDIEPEMRATQMAIRYDWLPIKGFNARLGSPRVRMAPDGKAD